MRELSRADAELEARRRQRVEAARRRGATWDQIGESLGTSRQSAWEYYTRQTRRVLNETAASANLDEDEAMRVATEEVSRVRAATPDLEFLSVADAGGARCQYLDLGRDQ